MTNSSFKEMVGIDKELMEAGYLCPDHTPHEWELLEWEKNKRDMKCKKCGNITLAMAITSLSETNQEK